MSLTHDTGESTAVAAHCKPRRPRGPVYTADAAFAPRVLFAAYFADRTPRPSKVAPGQPGTYGEQLGLVFAPRAVEMTPAEEVARLEKMLRRLRRKLRRVEADAAEAVASIAGRIGPIERHLGVRGAR